MGPEHLGVRLTQCTPCAEMAWLVILYLLFILEYPSEKLTLEDRKCLEQSAAQGV